MFSRADYIYFLGNFRINSGLTPVPVMKGNLKSTLTTIIIIHQYMRSSLKLLIVTYVRYWSVVLRNAIIYRGKYLYAHRNEGENQHRTASLFRQRFEFHFQITFIMDIYLFRRHQLCSVRRSEFVSNIMECMLVEQPTPETN